MGLDLNCSNGCYPALCQGNSNDKRILRLPGGRQSLRHQLLRKDSSDVQKKDRAGTHKEYVITGKSTSVLLRGTNQSALTDLMLFDSNWGMQ